MNYIVARDNAYLCSAISGGSCLLSGHVAMLAARHSPHTSVTGGTTDRVAGWLAGAGFRYRDG